MRARDLRRAAMLRECAGRQGTIMFDANQQWTLPAARVMCPELAKLKPLWIEEPTHPDDMMAHAALARETCTGQDRLRRAHPQPRRLQEFLRSAGDALCAGRLHAARRSQ